MTNFTCESCQTTLGDADMIKHISSTRHNSILHSRSQQQLQCEACGLFNVHQLVISRFGGTDMMLLCQGCLSKETDKPSTEYTVQNGALLKNVENYFKVRDLQCSKCGGDRRLNINALNPSLVICDACLKSSELSKDDFINENDDSFLYVLLNIPQNKKTRSKKPTRTRKAGRGKFSKKPVKPKRIVVTPSQNSETLRSFKALSRAEVELVKPIDEKRISSSRDKEVSRPNHSSERYSKSSSRDMPKAKAKLGKNISSTPTKSTSNKKPPQFDRTSSSRTTQPRNESKATTESLSQQFKKLSTNGTKKDIKTRNSKNDVKSFGQEPVKSNLNTTIEKKTPSSVKRSSNAAKHNVPDNSTLRFEKKVDNNARSRKTDKPDRVRSSQKGIPNQGKPEVKSTGKSTRSNTLKPERQNRDNQTKQNRKKETENSRAKELITAAPSTDDDHEEFEYFPKYLSNQPKLSYDSLSEYFKEMCFHLYLEEKLETSPIFNFELEWHQNHKNLFKVIIPYTEEIEALVPPKLRNLGRLPFTINQSMFVAKANDRDNIWDCFVKDLDVTKKGKKKITLLLELYKWNDASNFPIGSRMLSLLPCSVPISRVLYSMARIENPKFIKMLLGKEPIKELHFNNRLTFSKDTFNDSQKRAIQHVLNNAITVLQGPPGTGKTSTIYEIILQLLRNLRTFPVLTVAQSNIAIDNIAEKLKNNSDLKILRIVSLEKEKVYNEKHHLREICLHHKVNEMLPQGARDTQFNMRMGLPVSQNQYKKYLTTLNSISQRLVAQAQVILTTTVVAGGNQLKSIGKVPVVIMDESTQSSEAFTLIPLSMQGVDRFIFVGDDKQLSSFSEVPYLEQSLFERVLKNGTYKGHHMLDVQYRMHPKISAFPIKQFYDNLLKDGISPADRYIEGIEPLSFVDYGSKYVESKVFNRSRGAGSGYTYTNKDEALLVLEIMKKLIFTRNIDRSNISVITPYSAQRDLIADIIKNDSLINPNGDSIEEDMDADSLLGAKTPATIKTICSIMVSSIDAFQGREKDFVIFSCVRSNATNTIGFVKDPRRLNVALTRARNGLILVGNKSCLAQGEALWNQLIAHLETEGCVSTHEDYYLFK